MHGFGVLSVNLFH